MLRLLCRIASHVLLRRRICNSSVDFHTRFGSRFECFRWRCSGRWTIRCLIATSEIVSAMKGRHLRHCSPPRRIVVESLDSRSKKHDEHVRRMLSTRADESHASVQTTRQGTIAGLTVSIDQRHFLPSSAQSFPVVFAQSPLPLPLDPPQSLLQRLRSIRASRVEYIDATQLQPIFPCLSSCVWS